MVAATIDGAQQTFPLSYDASDLATLEAALLTSSNLLNTSNATIPGDIAKGPFTSLVVPASYAPSTGAVAASGYSTVIVGETAGPITVRGGGDTGSGGQTVIAGDAGLNFTSSDSTNTEVVAGGGNSNIDLGASSGQNQVYLADGNNTVTTGGGAATVDAGVGNNTIFSAYLVGQTATFMDIVEGSDNITLARPNYQNTISYIYVGSLDGGTNTASATVTSSYVYPYIGQRYSPLGEIYFQSSSNRPSSVDGGTSGSDTLLGGSGGGYFAGGDFGNNILIGGSAPVTLFGGGTYSYFHFTATGYGNFLEGSTVGSDSLSAGNGTSNVLYARADNDTMLGGSGSSLFEVAGADTVNLASGNDTVAIGPATMGEVDTAHAYITGGSGETLVYGGGNASTLTASTGSDTVFANAGGGVFAGGSAGSNILVGGAGAVTLSAAGAGNYLQGSITGADSLVGGSASSVTMVAEAAGDTVVGGSGNNTIDLIGAADTVNLGSGAATVQVNTGGYVAGGSGSLYFVGGSAASTVMGGAGTETIFAGSGGGYFTAGASGGANVMIGGSGAATLVGSAGAYIKGNYAAVADLLQAGGGNETLAAGLGADTMVAGTGADVFSFTNDLAGQGYTIIGYTTGDALYVRSQADISAALASATVSGGSTAVLLADGSRVTLKGFTGGLTASNFAHA